jgi:DNA-binding response OmpR family regulator
VNRGADSYIVRPFRMDDLLNTVKEHLRKQQDAKKHGEEIGREFIETRAAEIEAQIVDSSPPSLLAAVIQQFQSIL